jgi:hypothetical protein
VNEFVVLDVDYLRELKEKFMLVWEAQFVADIGGPENLAEGIDYETFVRDHRELVEKTFDDLIEASENPPPPLLH